MISSSRTETQTDGRTDTKLTTVGTLSGFQEFFLQPIIKDRPKKMWSVAHKYKLLRIQRLGRCVQRHVDNLPRGSRVFKLHALQLQHQVTDALFHFQLLRDLLCGHLNRCCRTHACEEFNQLALSLSVSLLLI